MSKSRIKNIRKNLSWDNSANVTKLFFIEVILDVGVGISMHNLVEYFNDNKKRQSKDKKRWSTIPLITSNIF